MKDSSQTGLPLTVREVMILENIVLGHSGKGDVDRYFAGCFLFMVFARARFSDMQNVSKLQLEVVQGQGFYYGYVETEVARSETSFSADRKVRLLPMSATVRGFTDESWAVAWKTVMEETGIEVGPGKPLLPGRAPDGWHTLPLTAESATAWLRTLLRSDEEFDSNRLHGIGAHSCKSTCLSWMSKFGTDKDTRRLMGYRIPCCGQDLRYAHVWQRQHFGWASPIGFHH